MLMNWTMVPLPLANQEDFATAMHKLKIFQHVKRVQPQAVIAGDFDQSKHNLFSSTLHSLLEAFKNEVRALPKKPIVVEEVSGDHSNAGDSMGFYEGILNIPEEEHEPRDTFLKLDGWTKVFETI